MRLILVAAIGWFLASGASAQSSTTTDCTRDYGGNVHCTTKPSGVNWGLLNQQPSQPNAGQSFMNGFEQGQRMRAQIEAQRAAQAARRAAEQQAANDAAVAEAAAAADQQTKHAAEMIKGGDCAGAEQFALDAANLELAKQVKDYCAK